MIGKNPDRLDDILVSIKNDAQADRLEIFSARERNYGLAFKDKDGVIHNITTVEDEVELEDLDLTGTLTVDTINESTEDAGVTIEGVLIKDGIIIYTAPNNYTSETNITAFVGGGQGSATQLTKEQNIVTTVATDGDSVKLPSVSAGLRVTVKNNGDFTLAVFPFLGDTINSGAVNASVLLVPGATAIFLGEDSTNWETTIAAPIATPVYSLGDAAAFVVLAGDDLTDTAPQFFTTGDVGYVTSETGTQTFGTGSLKTGVNLGSSVADVASLKATLLALAGTNITSTAAALETTNVGFGPGTFTPGVYTTASAVGVSASAVITLSGDGDYVFKSTAGAMTFGASVTIVLTNGAKASRVFFVASTDLSTTGASSKLKGNFLMRDITVAASNIFEGRLLASRDVTIDGTTSNIYLPLS